MKYKWTSPDESQERVLEGSDMKSIEKQASKLDKLWEASFKSKSIMTPTADSTTREKGRAVAQGGTLGFQDEIQGAMGATMDVLGGVEPVMNWTKAYRNHRDDERLAQDVYAIQHPKENFALQMAGGMALPGGNAMRTVQGLGKWRQMAKLGGMYGGAAGFGTAEGEPDAQALQTGVGAAFGAGMGVGAPFAGQLIGEGARQGAQMVGNRMGPALQRAGASIRAPFGGQAYRNMPTGALTGPERTRLAQRATELGMELTPGERLNSHPMRQAEASMRSSPLSPVGWRLNQGRTTNRKAIDNFTAEAMGAQPTGEVSASLVSGRAERLAQVFNRIESAMGSMRIDNQARRELNQLMNKASDPRNPNKKAMATIRRLQTSQDFNQPMSGQQLARLRTQYANEGRKAWAASDANMGEFHDELVGVLEGIVDRQVARNAGRFTKNQNLPKIWAKARSEWMVVKALRRPGVIKDGHVQPAAFSAALKQMDKYGYRDMKTAGQNTPRAKLYDALRINEYFGDVVGDSGTATRSAFAAQSGEGLLKTAGKAATSAVVSPVGSAYMKFGTEGMMRPNGLAGGIMNPVVGAFGANDSVLGGAFGEENPDE